MSNLVAIHAAFRQKLQTLDYDIAFQNVPFTPKAGEIYLRESFHPGRKVEHVISRADKITEYKGFYQVSVYSPSDIGLSKLNIAVDKILMLYQYNDWVACARITQEPDEAAGYNDGAFYIIPITIYFKGLIGNPRPLPPPEPDANFIVGVHILGVDIL